MTKGKGKAIFRRTVRRAQKHAINRALRNGRDVSMLAKSAGRFARYNWGDGGSGV
jgi:hypothetical protein